MFGLPPNATAWLGVGALLVVVGYLVRFQGWTFLLAGYDRTSPVPEDAAAEIAGNTILRIGLASLGLGAVVVLADAPEYLSAVFAAVIVLAVARLVYRLNTYTPTEAA